MTRCCWRNLRSLASSLFVVLYRCWAAARPLAVYPMEPGKRAGCRRATEMDTPDRSVQVKAVELGTLAEQAATSTGDGAPSTAPSLSGLEPKTRNTAASYMGGLLNDVLAASTFGVFAIPTMRKASAATAPPSRGPAQ